MALKLTIGNTAKESKNGERWEWQMFVRPVIVEDEDAYNQHYSSLLVVESVLIKLHPTFRKRIHELEKSHNDEYFFSQKFNGWGTFCVEVRIQMSQGRQYTFGHELDFLNGGKQQDIQIDHPATVLRSQISMQPYLKHNNDGFWHGRMLTTSPNLNRPKVTWQSSQKPRDDHGDVPGWLTATEFEEEPDTLTTKIECLAQLLQQSRKTVVYSGAGISVAAGIGQAARGGNTKNKRVRNLSTTALPTTTHYALATLAQRGLIHGWVQQNHDGLPQKAGFPQECINEVHGSWYDPSNPVVKYTGTLRDYECDWMEKEADTADLALVLGTSLGGLNADQVALTPAKRSKSGHALGMVMINIQQTEHDGKATLRMFSTTDSVLSAVLAKLGIPLQPNAMIMPMVQSAPAPSLPGGQQRTEGQRGRFLVPYDEKGRRSDRVSMWLDLRPGAEIQLSPNHHNITGAQQPAYMHMSAMKQPKGKVIRWRDSTCGIDICLEGVGMLLGQWWVEAALRGGPEVLPLVNVNPELVPVRSNEIYDRMEANND